MAPSRAFEDFNVVIILVDTLRADHLGCYGYERPTSPAIDRLAAEGVLFERAISPSSFTRESVTALFQGRYPSSNAWGSGWNATPDRAVAGFATRFRQAGYRTALFTDTPMFEGLTFYDAFDESECLLKSYDVSGYGPKVTERALEFVRGQGDGKFAMYLHYLDPHSPYSVHGDRLVPPPDENPLQLYDIIPAVPELVAEGFGPGDPRFTNLVWRYDAEIAHVDESIAALLEGIRTLGLGDRTLVVLLSDHGEEFLDHGFVEHSWNLYWESVHVPLIFWAPGALPPARVDQPVSPVDILPTLLTFKGIPYGDAGFDGVPLFTESGGQWHFGAPERLILSELLLQHRSIVRMAADGRHTYYAAQKWLTPAQCSQVARVQRALINAYETGQRPPFDLWGPLVHEELYDRSVDPRQQRNILSGHPDIAAALRAAIERQREKAPLALPDVDKLKTLRGVTSRDLEEQLRAIGYLGPDDPRESEGARF